MVSFFETLVLCVELMQFIRPVVPELVVPKSRGATKPVDMIQLLQLIEAYVELFPRFYLMSSTKTKITVFQSVGSIILFQGWYYLPVPASGKKKKIKKSEPQEPI